MRALAVTAVIIHHFNGALLPSGFLGVDIFFVISGYVISCSLASESQRSTSDFLLRFYVRRVKRILPALATCILLTAVLSAIVIPPTAPEYTRILLSGAWALFGASNLYFFSHATDYFAASTQLNLYTHTWSLGVEEQFYLAFPLLFLFCARAGRDYFSPAYLFTYLAVAVSLLAYFWLSKSRPSAAYFLMPTRFWELAAGFLVYLILGGGTAKGSRPTTIIANVAMFGLIASLFLPIKFQALATLSAVVFVALIIANIAPGSYLYRLLTLSPVIGLGLISYSLYLWHWSVLSLSRWTIGVSAWTAPVQLTLMFALAIFSYVAIERPLRTRKWSSSAIGTLGYGLCTTALGLLVLGVLIKPLGLVLYQGKSVVLAQKGVETLLKERRVGNNVLWTASDCVLSSNDDVGKKIDAQRCLLAGRRAANDRLFAIVGNSFSAAEVELVDVLRQKDWGAVIVTSSWGASPVSGIPNNTAWAGANAYYWDTVVPSLLKELRRGDFLLMISDVSDLTPQRSLEKPLQSFAANLEHLVGQMDRQGINVIFQNAIPYMRESGCSPDMAQEQWYDQWQGPRCTYFSKADTLRRRDPFSKTLEGIRQSHPNFHVLDLMPVFCPGNVCKMYNDQNVFLYRDTYSHPSVEADLLARPILEQLVGEIIGTETSAITSTKLQ